jgi:hypothetical protein
MVVLDISFLFTVFTMPTPLTNHVSDKELIVKRSFAMTSRSTVTLLVVEQFSFTASNGKNLIIVTG